MRLSSRLSYVAGSAGHVFYAKSALPSRRRQYVRHRQAQPHYRDNRQRYQEYSLGSTLVVAQSNVNLKSSISRHEWA